MRILGFAVGLGVIAALAGCTIAWVTPGGWSMTETTVVCWWVGFGAGAFIGTASA